MLILHILPSYAPGGHRRRIGILYAGLGAEFRHRIVAMDGGVGAGQVEPGVSLAPFAGVSSNSLHLGTMRRLAHLLSRERPAVLITYNWGAIEAALVNRVLGAAPHLHCEDGFSGAAARHGEPLRRAVVRRLVLARSNLAVPSSGLAATAHRSWGIPQGRIALIRNGVDVARFAQARAARRLRSADEVVIGMLSRLSAEKNIALLLRAFARLAARPRTRLAIAGDGPERAGLESLAARLGIAERVRFLGHIEDPVPFLTEVDVFAISSVTEQLPFSLLEAMAAGLPVVATDVGDIRDTLAPANRELLAPPGDEAMLARHLTVLMESPELRSTLGAGNAERARTDFDQQQMIDGYRALLQAMARSSGRVFPSRAAPTAF